MAALLTIAQIIQVGDVSIYLSANDNASGALWGRRLSSPKSSLEIAMTTDSLRWGLEGDPTASTLRGTANYLLWMCGMYSLQAQNIISGSGGGTVVPGTPTTPLPLQFIVAASGNAFNTGDTSATLTSFIGFNLLFSRNGQPISTVTSQPSYYTWDKVTGIMTISVQAYADDLFQIYPI